MKKEDLIKLGLDEVLSQKVADASSEELKEFVSKVKFNKLEEDKKQLESDIKVRDSQLETLKKLPGSIEDLQKKITNLQAANATKEAEYAAKIKQMQIDSAVEKALSGAKAKNIKSVKALLDLEKAELDGENVKGLDEQLKKLIDAEDTKFLFNSEQAGQHFRGINPGESADETPNPVKLGYASRLAEARKSDNTLEAIKIKQEAANENIILI